MIELLDMILPVLVGASMFGGLIFMIWRASASTPLFPMRCRDCGHRDRQWETVATGHDDFAWQHKCLFDRLKRDA